MAGNRGGRGNALRNASASVSAMLSSSDRKGARGPAADSADAGASVNEHMAAHRNYKKDRVVDLTGELGEGPGKYHHIVRRVPRYETYYNRSEQEPHDYELYRAAKWLDDVSQMAQVGLTRSVLACSAGGSPYDHMPINERAAMARLDVDWVDWLFTRTAQPVGKKRSAPTDLGIELRILRAVIVDDQTFTEFGLAERPFNHPAVADGDAAGLKAREVAEKAHKLAVKRWAGTLYKIAVNRLLLSLKDRAPRWFAPVRPRMAKLDGSFDYSGIEKALSEPALAM